MHYKHGKVNMITLSDRELHYKNTGDLNIPMGLLDMASQIVAMTQLKRMQSLIDFKKHRDKILRF